jgi:hypothetical protein
VLSAGTSASAPIVAGMVSLLNANRLAAGKSAVGLLTPHLYRMRELYSNAFNVIKPSVCGLSRFPAFEFSYGGMINFAALASTYYYTGYVLVGLGGESRAS